MNLHSIHMLVTSTLLRWMKWSLGGIYLKLIHYVGGMQTHLMHNLSTFQACVKMKPNPSIVFFSCFKLVKKWNNFQVSSSIVSNVSRLCKNETILTLPLVISIFISLFLPDEPWFFHSIVTISLANHTLSLGCFTFSWGTSTMSGIINHPLNLYMFWVVPS